MYESKFLKLWDDWETSLPEGEGAPKFLKKERFLAGSIPSLQEKVRGKLPVTFDDALQWAREKDCKLKFRVYMAQRGQMLYFWADIIVNRK